MKQQGDLFAPSETAHVTTFPLARQIGRIRAIADRLEPMPAGLWQKSFNSIVRPIRAELIDIGTTDAEVVEQMTALADAVSIELDHRQTVRRSNG